MTFKRVSIWQRENAYHVWEAGYLADQANIKRTNQKKKRYNNFYNEAIFLFIALADKG